MSKKSTQTHLIGFLRSKIICPAMAKPSVKRITILSLRLQLRIQTNTSRIRLLIKVSCILPQTELSRILQRIKMKVIFQLITKGC